MRRMQRQQRAGAGEGVDRYVPAALGDRVAPRRYRRVVRKVLYDWRVDEVRGFAVLPASPDKPRLQQRFIVHAALRYKPAFTDDWQHHLAHDAVQSFTFEELAQDQELGELLLGAWWDFMRDCYVAHPTSMGLVARLGQHAPERLPPMTAQQVADQQAAFEHTEAMVALQVAADYEQAGAEEGEQ